MSPTVMPKQQWAPESSPFRLLPCLHHLLGSHPCTLRVLDMTANTASITSLKRSDVGPSRAYKDGILVAIAGITI